MKNGKEIFEMLYDNKIQNDECIEVIYEDEENHFITRCDYGNSKYGDFDDAELMSSLLFKEYKFKIIKQEEAYKRLEAEEKREKIQRLEEELKKIRGE